MTALTEDTNLTTQEIMNLLKDGDDDFTGIADRITGELPDTDLDVVIAHPEKIVGEGYTYSLPLEKAVISMYDLEDAPPGQFFKNHVLPGAAGYGWKREPEIRWDVWTRTPPESRTLTDVLRKQLIKAGRELWSAYRIGLVVNRAYEVPVYYEQLETPSRVYHKYLNTMIRTIEIEA